MSVVGPPKLGVLVRLVASARTSSLHALVHGDALEERRVDFEPVRSDEEVAAGVAELAGAGGGEFGALGGVEVPEQAGGGLGEGRSVAAAAAGAVGGGLVDVAHGVGAGEGGERTAAGDAAVSR